jgi:hypothetical protein
VRFEAHHLIRALKLASDPGSALPSCKVPQESQIGGAPEDSLATRAWHARLPDTKELTLYMWEPNYFWNPQPDASQDLRNHEMRTCNIRNEVISQRFRLVRKCAAAYRNATYSFLGKRATEEDGDPEIGIGAFLCVLR